MKKYLLLFFLFVMFIPFMVNAETCENDKITISSIKVDNKSDNVDELEEATASGKNINLNISMSEVGDNIEYKITVKNDSNEDYELDKNSFNVNSDYFDYTLDSKDNSKIVKAKSSKTVYLRVEYKNEVPENQFESGTYNDRKSMSLQLSTGNALINPNTSTHLYIMLSVIIILICGTLCVLLKKKEYAKYVILIIGTTVIIPMSTYSLCKCDIKINSNIRIVKDSNPCHIDIGNNVLTEGMEYINGQYTYHYKQEYSIGMGPYENTIYYWESFNDDGWGVASNDKMSSTINSKICTSINGKPIVSMKNMYLNSNAENIDLSEMYTYNVKNMQSMFSNVKVSNLDLSNFDTSNVIDMSYMFENVRLDNLNISHLNTTKVKNMSHMFYWSNINNLIYTGIDTSNVEDMSGMFLGYKSQNLDLSKLNTSNVTDMSDMFCFSDIQNLDLSNLDTSKVENMGSMFYGISTLHLNLSSFDTSNVKNMGEMFHDSAVEELNLENFNTSNVINMNGMFKSIELESLDLTSFNTSKVTSMESMFMSAKISNLNLSSFDTKNVKSMVYMFNNLKNISVLDLSSFDTSGLNDGESNNNGTWFMFSNCSATTGYARTQDDADRFNNSTQKPNSLSFILKN